MMTDPEAMKDPERVKAWQRSQRNETRRRVLGSLRTNSIVMILVGSLCLGAGTVTGVLALSPWSSVDMPLVAVWVPLGIGGLFVFFGQWLSPGTTTLARRGEKATATVVEVKSLDRNVSIRQTGLSATAGRITLLLRVLAANGTSVDVLHREFILGSDLTHFKLGSTIPVRHAPGDPTRLAFDWESS